MALNVTDPKGSTQLFTTEVGGTVDLATLNNVTKTIASIAVPNGWQVTAVTLYTSGIRIFVNGTLQSVTPLSNTFTTPVVSSTPINQSLTGSILDLSPTVSQIQVVNATNGQLTNSLVFMPGGVALPASSLNSTQSTVGTVSNMTTTTSAQLRHLARLYQKDLSLTSYQLSASGNMTTFSVTVENNGTVALPIYGINVRGDFNMTSVHYNCGKNGKNCHESSHEKQQMTTLPFWVNGTTLQPMLGSLNPGGGTGAPYMLGANQSVTFSYSGVIQVLKQYKHGYNHIVLTPVSGNVYRLTVLGIGRARFHVQAT